MVRQRFAFLAATFACMPFAAGANAGIGVLTTWLPAAIVALLPAILLEALVLARMLGVGFRRGLGVSASANIWSTLAGGFIAVAGDVMFLGAGPEPGREAVLFALAPMFFVTWFIERAVVKRLQPAAAKVTSATLAANAFTYVVMAIAAIAWVPPIGTYASRWRLGEGIHQMGVVRNEVAEAFQRTGAFPPPRSYAAKGNLARLDLEAGGRIVGRFSFPRSPDAHGRSVVLQPRLEQGRIVEWLCYSPDMNLKYLPAACRRSSP